MAISREKSDLKITKSWCLTFLHLLRIGARNWLCIGEKGSGSDIHVDPFSVSSGSAPSSRRVYLTTKMSCLTAILCRQMHGTVSSAATSGGYFTQSK